MNARDRRQAFTLIEVLVSVAVLSFIILMLAQMMDVVSAAWREGVSRVDNFTKSRAMLDLVASDLQHAVIRPDLPIFQTNGVYTPSGGFTGGTYSASLVTRVPGQSSTATRDVSCVTYGVVTTTDSDKIVLERSDLPIGWTSAGASIPFQSSLSQPLGAVTPREMAPGVVGFQFAFRHADGTVTATYTGYDSTNPVVAVGVTIAVVGERALNQLPLADLTTIQTHLTSTVSAASLDHQRQGPLGRPIHSRLLRAVPQGTRRQPENLRALGDARATLLNHGAVSRNRDTEVEAAGSRTRKSLCEILREAAYP